MRDTDLYGQILGIESPWEVTGGVPSIAGAYRFEVDVTIPEGTYTVAAGVRDETTGVMSLVRKDVAVPLAPPE